MNKFIAVFKKIGNGIKNVYKFITDWRYRRDVMDEHWNWKSKLLVILMIPVLLFTMVMFIERDSYPRQVKEKDSTGKVVMVTTGTPTWKLWYGCFMEDWDVGRETEFSIITGSCVIDSGRKDENGAVVWQKVERDVAAGDFSQ